MLLHHQAVQDNVGNGIDAKPSAGRTKQEHSSDKMLVGDEADVTGSSTTAREKPKASQAKEHSKATEPESKSSSKSDDKKVSSSEKTTKSSTVNGPSKSEHTSKRTSDTGAAESQGSSEICMQYHIALNFCGLKILQSLIFMAHYFLGF